VFLKRVEIFGFKSFADKTVIEFSDGISALLGPNGCGKSNVVDAVKWVLGEQSSKTLRAEKMEDVIFNGTEQRKALSVADVTLVLNNEPGLLALDFPEIAIKRRLYRSGDSEYFLNNTPVRLRELKELFFDTGVGKSAYSIMEQGKIDQVLSNKPEERRYLFEEAAGITKYKIRRAEAERKLSKTEENMRQVEGILAEVKRSHDSLKIQSDKAEAYRQIKSEIFEIELDIQLIKLRNFLKQKDDKTANLQKQQSLRTELKEKIDKINELLEANLDEVNSMETSLSDCQKKLYGISLQRNNLDAQQGILLDRKGEIESQIALLRERSLVLEEKLESLQDEIGEKNRIIEEFSLRISEIQKNIEEFHKNIESAAKRIQDNESETTRLREDAGLLEEEAEMFRLELEELTDRIVKELESGLGEYSPQRKKELEEDVLQMSSKMLLRLDSRLKMVSDASGTDSQKLLQLLSNQLKEDLSSGKELHESVKKLISMFPPILDELFSPKGILTKKKEIDSQLKDRLDRAEANRAQAERLREENDILKEKIEEYRNTLEQLRLDQMRLNTQQSGILDAVDLLNRELSAQMAHREQNELEIQSNIRNMEDLNVRMEDVRRQKEELDRDELATKKTLEDLEKKIREHNADLEESEQEVKSRMENLAMIQEKIERIQLDLVGVQTEVRNVLDNFREKHSRDLMEYEQRMVELDVQSQDLRAKLQSSKETLRNLGSVNLMAPEEYAEVKERYDFLNNQLEDLRKAREDLASITEQIRTESSELFLDTYNKIKKNFHVMFRRLFGGGRAELRLSDPENILESGIEIFAQPPGKKLENIALLSGGERSMTAVGLLFATYMVRPSPFCILDEIDAALDEANVGRFVNVLTEFGNSSQFIVITHNKKTVAGARTLLGVTMEESGVSKAVSIRLAAAEEQREPVPDA
jgi:chromosome segregation protein